jgi:hypothetical protein
MGPHPLSYASVRRRENEQIRSNGKGAQYGSSLNEQSNKAVFSFGALLSASRTIGLLPRLVQIFSAILIHLKRCFCDFTAPVGYPE